MTFSVFNAIKHLHDNDSYFRVDVIEAIVSNQLGPLEPLETNLTHEDPSSCEDDLVWEYMHWMDSFGSNRRKYLNLWELVQAGRFLLLRNHLFLKRNNSLLI